MSSSSTPSLGVVSVTITLPGPWTVITHLSPARSVPETTLPWLLKPGLLGLLGLTRLVAVEQLTLMGDRVGHQQIGGYPGRSDSPARPRRAAVGSPGPRAGRFDDAESNRTGQTAAVRNSWKTPSPAARERAPLRRSGDRPIGRDAPEAALPGSDGHPAPETLRNRLARKAPSRNRPAEQPRSPAPCQRNDSLTPLSIGAPSHPSSWDL